MNLTQSVVVVLYYNNVIITDISPSFLANQVILSFFLSSTILYETQVNEYRINYKFIERLMNFVCKTVR